MMRSAQDLLNELNLSDESPSIEAKRSREVGKSLLETVIAFANEPGLKGGWLLLGVNWEVNDKGDTVYWPEGIPDPDKLQKDLASQCASALNIALRPEISVERLQDKTVIVVFIAEADTRQKPIYLKATGLPRGAYRRIGSTDQRCTDEDLWVLRGESQPQQGPDLAVLPDARLDDFDPAAIKEYRRERVRINPRAEELDYSDEELLEALGAVRRVDKQLHPTLAGIVLFGKSIALRRLMPMLRIDYIRVAGTEWVQDPEERFHSIDIRKPLLLALPVAEASIVDELPRGFHLPEGQLQSRQEPVLPRKVIREALANAVMHRSYQLNSPIQIVRYSNRIEVHNPGYALKDVSQLGVPGSKLRNPAIAAVLHDLNWAETKGTGIRTMRRLSANAGLPLPKFTSDRQNDGFKATLFLHHLLTEDDYAWLKTLAGDTLSAEEAKVLIYTRETGAVDNSACRDFSGLDTLQASSVLRRLRDRSLLEKQGSGNRTYYTLSAPGSTSEQGLLPLGNDTEPAITLGDSASSHKLGTNSHKLDTEFPQAQPEISASLLERIKTLGSKPRQQTLRNLIIDLCSVRPFSATELCDLFGRKDPRDLTRNHLKPMREAGHLILRFPESTKHPHQAYMVPEVQESDRA